MSSVPAASARLVVSPPTLTLSFNAALTLPLCRLTLVASDGQAITLDSLQLAPGDNKTLTARVTQTLPPGRYTVRWQAAGADGHPVRGEYLFEVAESAPVPEIRSTRFSSRDLGALFR